MSDMNIPIVNTKDEIIGSKPRADLNFTTDIFRTASLWITNPSGDVLLAQRKLDKKVDPGKWAEAIGGTVEGNDSYEQTVIREAKEEIGLDIEIGQITIGPKQLITTPCTYFVQWYTATVNQPIQAFVVQKEELENLAWIPLAQLEQELVTTPQKYIAAMPEIVRLLK